MSSDLRTLLQEQAARPTSPLDVDELFARVGRRQRARMAIGVAAVIAVAAGIVGVLQMAFEMPPAPVVEEVPESSLESSLMESGALDRGIDAVLSLDPDTGERLRGSVLAQVTVDADVVAVAADRAIGIRQGDTLTILVDGEGVASGQLDGSSDDVTWWGRDALAFDSDGTLWALQGRTLVGLRRNGEMTTIEDALTPIPGPEGGVGLRITGTNVSILVHDLASDEPGLAYGNWDVPLATQVVPVVGQDPLAGTVSMELRSQLPGGAPLGLDYVTNRAAGLSKTLLAATTIVGDVAAELDWSDPPSEDLGFSSRFAQSQVVAGTAASLQWFELYDGSFLTVAREGGTSLVALVETGPHDGVSVSPDGAVHLVTRHQDGTFTVRNLLTADLRPLSGPPIGGLAAVPTADPIAADEPQPPAWGCDQLPDGDEVIDELQLDLDEDGELEPVSLLSMRSDPAFQGINAWDVLLVCFADGTGASEIMHDPPDRLEAVDLAGTPGVAGVRTTGDGRETYELAGWRRGFRDPMRTCTWNADGGSSCTSVPLVDQITPVPGRTNITTFGCRSASDDGRLEVLELRIGGIDEIASSDGGRREYRGADLDVTYVVHRIAQDWSQISDSTQRVSIVATNGVADPAEILGDLGASWLCRP